MVLWEKSSIRRKTEASDSHWYCPVRNWPFERQEHAETLGCLCSSLCMCSSVCLFSHRDLASESACVCMLCE